MTNAEDCHHCHSNILLTGNMKLASSASEQNVYFTYVCLIDDLQRTKIPTPECGHRDKSFDTERHSDEKILQEEPTIKVERTQAFYELVESSNRDSPDDAKPIRDSDSSTYPTTSGEENDSDAEKGNTFLSCDNPNILKLTKMKWLSEDPDSGGESSSPSVSSITSNTSTCSKNSECETNNTGDLNEKYLSTILRLDKEHNMFGLSSITIIGPRQSKQKRTKDDERPVFHQTAIVQVCCAKSCCKYLSNTDMPSSLKCGVCRSCCFSAIPKCGISCFAPPSKYACKTTCPKPCCASSICCGKIVSSKTSCVNPCRKLPGPPCRSECNDCFGLQIKINRKPNYRVPGDVQLTPRNSSILQKPVAARPCTHTPPCIPPSSCYPYLSPCFWPASPKSPCSMPAMCFHNPPCPAPRFRQKVPFPPQYKCPKGHLSCGKEKTPPCTNEVCLAKIPGVKEKIEEKFGQKSQAKTPSAPSPPAKSPPDKSPPAKSPPAKSSSPPSPPAKSSKKK